MFKMSIRNNAHIRLIVYNDLLQKLSELKASEVDYQSQEPKQMKVSEELQYQNLTCLVNGFELTTYQKSLDKQEYDKLLSMKEREAVEVDKKIICRNCKSTAVYQEVGTFICGECNASW
jgi:hypothetical protein